MESSAAAPLTWDPLAEDRDTDLGGALGTVRRASRLEEGKKR